MADSPINGQDAVTLRDNERKLHALYVTAERQKWRDRIREIVIETVDIAAKTGSLQPNEIHKLHVIRAELKVRLNLGDKNDLAIISHITEIIKHENNCTNRLKGVSDFEDEVSWLLKEDWERVKHETRPLWLWLYSERKVDRSNKPISVKESQLFFEWQKFLSFFFSIIILVAVLSSFTYGIGYAYQWTQPEGVRPQFKAAATEGTPKRFIFCQNCVHL